ncbi:hypothetical protein PCLA_15r0132 [Pseudomonas citronellolis]|nr:hypothetical protein PCLA_15r0132 [Pseudomonas citronellolis]
MLRALHRSLGPLLRHVLLHGLARLQQGRGQLQLRRTTAPQQSQTDREQQRVPGKGRKGVIRGGHRVSFQSPVLRHPRTARNEYPALRSARGVRLPVAGRPGHSATAARRHPWRSGRNAVHPRRPHRETAIGP